MDNKLIQQLVEKSFSNDKIDPKIVFSIADRLNRRQLKEYIKKLRKHLIQKTVIIETALPVSAATKLAYEESYKGKTLNFVTNKNLIVGVKIYENDIILSKNLKDTLENIRQYISE